MSPVKVVKAMPKKVVKAAPRQGGAEEGCQGGAEEGRCSAQERPCAVQGKALGGGRT